MDFIKKLIAVFLSLIYAVNGLFALGETEKREPLNIVFMIGDGMGYNHIASSSLTVIPSLPLHGSLKTKNATGKTTDSAAAGTALACGIKTNNGLIGVYPNGTDKAQSLTEYAHSLGMKTGIISTDYPYGATPAAFTAHTSSRDNKSEIIVCQQSGIFDLLWFAASDTYWTKQEAESLKYTYVTNAEQVNALSDGTRTMGEFKQSTMYKGIKSSVYGKNPGLADLTGKSLEILDNDDKGFFIMVEAAHIDKNSHDNDITLMQYAAQEFDKAVAQAVDFAKQDGNTLVIVTADHETGGLTANTDGTYSFTKTGHTSANVPLFIYGCDTLINNGEVLENSDFSNIVRDYITQNVPK